MLEPVRQERIMAILKPTQERFDSMRKAEASIRKEIEENIVISDGSKSKFWKLIQKKIEIKQAKIEERLDEYHTLTHDQVIGILESRRELRFFKELADQALNINRHLSIQLEKVNKEINGYKQRLNRAS